MEQIKGPRTGEAPLAFEGELLAEASGRLVGGKGRNRWHGVEVYRTAGGKYVLAIAYRTQWQGEQDHREAVVLGSLDEAAEQLRATVPTLHLEGYRTLLANVSPGRESPYRARQADLEAQLTRDWQHLAAEVLETIGVEERIA